MSAGLSRKLNITGPPVIPRQKKKKKVKYHFESHSITSKLSRDNLKLHATPRTKVNLKRHLRPDGSTDGCYQIFKEVIAPIKLVSCSVDRGKVEKNKGEREKKVKEKEN